MALAGERIFIKTHSTENRCYRTEIYTVWRRVPASFSPEIVQAGAVKGLIVRLEINLAVAKVERGKGV